MNPAGKITSIIAGMAAGADSIDDLQVVRSGGMTQMFTGVYAPATLGQFLREFTHGHTRQLASVARAHLVNLAQRTDLLAGLGHVLARDEYLRPQLYGKDVVPGRKVGHVTVLDDDLAAARRRAHAAADYLRGLIDE